MGRGSAGRARVLLLVVVALMSVGGQLAGCRLLVHDVPVGTLVASWSEADHDELAEDVRVEQQVVDDEASRAALLELLPRTEQHATLERADLSEVALVVLGYHRCVGTELRRDRDGLRFRIPEDQEQVTCVWAPYTVEVWRVPYDEVDSAPGELRLRG